MKYQVGDEFLQELPMILGGPILKHTEPESVTVWVAVKQSCQVELKVYDTTNDGEVIGNWALLNPNMNHAIASSLWALRARSATEPYLR